MELQSGLSYGGLISEGHNDTLHKYKYIHLVDSFTSDFHRVSVGNMWCSVLVLSLEMKVRFISNVQCFNSSHIFKPNKIKCSLPVICFSKMIQMIADLTVRRVE